MPEIEKFSTSTVTKESVLKAIEQFDRIGRAAFLEKFARGRAAQKGNKGRRKGPYFVEYKGKRYEATRLGPSRPFPRGLQSTERFVKSGD